MKAESKEKYMDAWRGHLSEMCQLAMWLTPEQFGEYKDATEKLMALIAESAHHQYECWQCKHCRRYVSLKLDRCIQCQSKRGQEQ